MHIKWLDDFVSLAKTRSFTRAAEERQVTLPAFGRRIKSLESWVGVPLVNRGTYPATLTEEGLLEKRRYSEHPPREEYLLTAAGRDFLPVLFMIGAWGRQYRGGGKLVQFFDAETGTEIKAVAVDEVTGAKIGTRPIRMVAPDES